MAGYDGQFHGYLFLTKRSNRNPGIGQTFLLERTDLIRANGTKKGVFSTVQVVTPEIALRELLHGEVTDHSSSVQGISKRLPWEMMKTKWAVGALSFA